MTIYRVYSGNYRFEKYFIVEELAMAFAIDCILQDLPNMILDGSIEHGSAIINLIKQSKYSEAIQKHLNFDPKYVFEYDEYEANNHKYDIENNMRIVENTIKEMVFK